MANAQTVDRQWLVVDAEGQIVGRLATKIATILMGKHKPTYTPHVECGDGVIVVNCEKVRFSGKPLANSESPYFSSKMLTKEYEYYTGYPSGQRFVKAHEYLKRRPDHILREAVRRMLPKNKLGRHMLSRLKLYKGPNHPHQAQLPQDCPDVLLK
ncbi:MAG: 50S ribosomal protein L13 [Planctomyces sp.]|nr:50S ribosomal protein L13 [Planctomyces sp.]